jgi:hypothetical protein
MSSATDVILAISCVDDERRGDLVTPGMASFRAWCEDDSRNGHSHGIGWPGRAKEAGSKSPMVAIYTWCVNHLSEDAFLEAVAAAPWHYPNDIQVMFRYEGAQHFRVYAMDRDRSWVESKSGVEEWQPARSGPKFVPLRPSLMQVIAAWKAAGGDVSSLRLYCDGSKVTPRRAAYSSPMDRSVGMRHAEAGLISPAGADAVYEIRNHPMLDEILYAGEGPGMVFPPTSKAVEGLAAEPSAKSIANALTLAVRKLDDRLYFAADDEPLTLFGLPVEFESEADRADFERELAEMTAKPPYRLGYDHLRQQAVRMEDGEGNIVRKRITLRGGPWDGVRTTVGMNQGTLIVADVRYGPSGEKADWGDAWGMISSAPDEPETPKAINWREFT